MDFEKLKEFRSTRSPFTCRLGIVVEDIQQGYAKATMRVTEDDTNSYGTVHGGCCYTLADIAAGAACASYGIKSMTASANYSYLGTGCKGDILTAVSKERKQGKHLGVYDVTVKNQEGALLGIGTFTYYMLDKPLNLEHS